MAGITEQATVFVSVGSNLGDKLGNCLRGIAAMTQSGHSVLRQTSRFFETAPVDYVQQPWFVNAVVKITTRLEPLTLLDELAAIQNKMGRATDSVRYGPRVLDLDILLYDQLTMCTPRLEIPHPRLHKRAFVLKPICDIDPTVLHPVLGKTAADLLGRLTADDQHLFALDNQPQLVSGRCS